MTHTWSDVAYGFFVGTNNDAPAIILISVLAFIAFVVWMASR